jgi:hypothetical protein
VLVPGVRPESYACDPGIAGGTGPDHAGTVVGDLQVDRAGPVGDASVALAARARATTDAMQRG